MKIIRDPRTPNTRSEVLRPLAGAFVTPALILALLLGLAVAPTAAAQKQPAEHWEDIQVPELPDQEVPKPKRVELDNGMVVLLLEDHELPLVEARAMLRTGSRLEPAEKAGVAEITGSVMRTGGTESMSSTELDEFLEDRAASVETGIGTTSGFASMSALTADYPEVLEVFADVLRHPAFEEDKLELAKTQQRSAISRQNDDPQTIAFREFQELIYGGESAYARSNTYESVGGISRQDLVDWHGEYLHPNRVILGLVGDFDSDQALAHVRQAFGDWQRGPAVPEDEVTSIAYDGGTGPGVFYVEKNDMTQSNIVIGHLGVEKSHPDYYAIEALNNILSGSFASRLFSSVRSEKGLAYTVFGSVGSNYDYPGVFTMFTTTKTETTGAAIDALIEEANKLKSQPPTAEELEKSKEAILKSFVFQSDSTREILAQQLRYEYFGYPLDWLERYRDGIDQVSLEEVRAAAKHVRPDDFAILVVGPAEGMDKPLSEYGEVTTVDITIPEPAAERTEVTAEGQARAQELLGLLLEAMGGADVVDQVASLRTSGSVTQQTPQGPMEIGVAQTVVFPGRTRQELTLPMGSITMVSTDAGAFMVSPQGTNDLPASRAEAMKRSSNRHPLALLKMRDDPSFSATALEPTELDGTPLERLQIEVSGDVMVAAIDPASGEMRQLSFRDQGPMGAPGDMVQTFSDWRQVDGLTYPFAIVGTFDGEPMHSTSLETVEVNPEVDDAEFEKPQ